MKFVGVTACPTGIAHTYMAQAALEKKAKELGYECKIETQGSIGVENELKKKEIAEADAVILAIEIGIEGMERFEDKKVFKVKVSEAITKPEKIFADIMTELNQ